MSSRGGTSHNMSRRGSANFFGFVDQLRSSREEDSMSSDDSSYDNKNFELTDARKEELDAHLQGLAGLRLGTVFMPVVLKYLHLSRKARLVKGRRGADSFRSSPNCLDALATHPYFGMMPRNELISLVKEQGHDVVFDPEEVLCWRFEPARSLGIIVCLTGTIVVRRRGEPASEVVGPVALGATNAFTGEPCMDHVTATTIVEAVHIPFGAVQTSLARLSQAKSIHRGLQPVMEMLDERQRVVSKYFGLTERLLEECWITSPLTHRQLDSLKGRMVPRCFLPGENLATAGKAHDAIIFIRSGWAEAMTPKAMQAAANAASAANKVPRAYEGFSMSLGEDFADRMMATSISMTVTSQQLGFSLRGGRSKGFTESNFNASTATPALGLGEPTPVARVVTPSAGGDVSRAVSQASKRARIDGDEDEESDLTPLVVGPGSILGEMGLVFGEKWHRTVRAKTVVDCWILPAADFTQMLTVDTAAVDQVFPAAASLRCQWLWQRRDWLTEKVIPEALRSVQYLEKAPQELIKKLAEAARPSVHLLRTCIASPAKLCDALTIVGRGIAATQHNSPRLATKRFGAGAVFGDRCVYEHRWNVPVVTTTMVECWSIPAVALRDLLTEFGLMPDALTYALHSLRTEHQELDLPLTRDLNSPWILIEAEEDKKREREEEKARKEAEALGLTYGLIYEKPSTPDDMTSGDGEVRPPRPPHGGKHHRRRHRIPLEEMDEDDREAAMAEAEVTVSVAPPPSQELGSRTRPLPRTRKPPSAFFIAPDSSISRPPPKPQALVDLEEAEAAKNDAGKEALRVRQRRSQGGAGQLVSALGSHAAAVNSMEGRRAAKAADASGGIGASNLEGEPMPGSGRYDDPEGVLTYFRVSDNDLNFNRGSVVDPDFASLLCELPTPRHHILRQSVSKKAVTEHERYELRKELLLGTSKGAPDKSPRGDRRFNRNFRIGDDARLGLSPPLEISSQASLTVSPTANYSPLMSPHSLEFSPVPRPVRQQKRRLVPTITVHKLSCMYLCVQIAEEIGNICPWQVQLLERKTKCDWLLEGSEPLPGSMVEVPLQPTRRSPSPSEDEDGSPNKRKPKPLAPKQLGRRRSSAQQQPSQPRHLRASPFVPRRYSVGGPSPSSARSIQDDINAMLGVRPRHDTKPVDPHSYDPLIPQRVLEQGMRAQEAAKIKEEEEKVRLKAEARAAAAARKADPLAGWQAEKERIEREGGFDSGVVVPATLDIDAEDLGETIRYGNNDDSDSETDGGGTSYATTPTASPMVTDLGAMPTVTISSPTNGGRRDTLPPNGVGSMLAPNGSRGSFLLGTASAPKGSQRKKGSTVSSHSKSARSSNLLQASNVKRGVSKRKPLSQKKKKERPPEDLVVRLLTKNADLVQRIVQQENQTQRDRRRAYRNQPGVALYQEQLETAREERRDFLDEEWRATMATANDAEDLQGDTHGATGGGSRAGSGKRQHGPRHGAALQRPDDPDDIQTKEDFEAKLRKNTSFVRRASMRANKKVITKEDSRAQVYANRLVHLPEEQREAVLELLRRPSDVTAEDTRRQSAMARASAFQYRPSVDYHRHSNALLAPPPPDSTSNNRSRESSQAPPEHETFTPGRARFKAAVHATTMASTMNRTGRSLSFTGSSSRRGGPGYTAFMREFDEAMDRIKGEETETLVDSVVRRLSLVPHGHDVPLALARTPREAGLAHHHHRPVSDPPSIIEHRRPSMSTVHSGERSPLSVDSTDEGGSDSDNSGPQEDVEAVPLVVGNPSATTGGRRCVLLAPK